MTRQVDPQIRLPRQWAAGGAEVKNLGFVNDHGLNILGRAQNTLYDQHRGQLVDDSEWDSEASILGPSVATNLRWRAPLWGRASLPETVTVGIWARGTGGPAGVVQFADGTNSANVAAPTGSAASVFKATATMSIIDNAEFADLTATYSSGTVGAVVSAFIYYNRTRGSLPASTAQYYPGTTFCANEGDLVGGEMPVTSALVYSYRDNASELYRRVGPAIGSSWGNAPLVAGDETGFVKPVPENVTTLRLYVDGSWTGVPGGFIVQTTREVKVGTFPAARGWGTVIDLDVAGLDAVSAQIYVGNNATCYGVSAYWMARSLPA